MAEITVERNDVVMSPGGVEAGRVEHVIVNELTQQITDLVVLRRDGTEFMVPIGNVSQQGPGVFLLQTPPERLATTHHFEPERFHGVQEDAINAAPAPASAPDNTIIHATHDAVTATGATGAAAPTIASPNYGAGGAAVPMTNMPSTPPTPPMPSLAAHPPAVQVHEATPTAPAAPIAAATTDTHAARTEIGDTTDSLREKLSPANLKEQITGAVGEQVAATRAQVTDAVHDTLATVKSSVAGATGSKTALATRTGSISSTGSGAASDAGNSLLAMVRANPVPVALMGVGIGWLLIQHRSGGSGGSGMSYASISHDVGPVAVPSFAYDAEAKPDASSARDTLGNAASTATATVGRLVGQASESVTNLAGTATGQVSDLAAGAQDGVSQGAQQVQSSFTQTLQENPMNIGIVALALGFAAGFLLPETPAENRLFGDSRDALLGQAQEQVQKAQRVAQDMQKIVQDIQATIPQAVKESAQRQGLTGQA